ncbi:UPF0218 protein [Candidatus Nitrosotalea sp. TS]|nr:UPF0218 protein [Candidatus Nitrosotalea sp. TS]
MGHTKTVLECVNPAAEITDESISVIKKAFQADMPVRIIVKGEEDLLVLPVVHTCSGEFCYHVWTAKRRTGHCDCNRRDKK